MVVSATSRPYTAPCSGRVYFLLFVWSKGQMCKGQIEVPPNPSLISFTVLSLKDDSNTEVAFFATSVIAF